MGSWTEGPATFNIGLVMLWDVQFCQEAKIHWFWGKTELLTIFPWNVCFMWIVFVFFMDTHMCYFEVLQKTDFCKDVFVAITSLLPKNSVLTSTSLEHKPSWLVRLIFLWCLTHISSQPLLFLMGLTVTSPIKRWLMHLRQVWCLVMWVRWHTWNMLKMLSAGFSRIWEEGPELHREQPFKLASSAALCTTGWKQLAWQYLLCWYEWRRITHHLPIRKLGFLFRPCPDGLTPV